MRRLHELNVHPLIIKWYHSFLTDHSQTVGVNGVLSAPQTLNTGAPQGSVSSPVLFTLYTNKCRSHNPNYHVIKISDDTAILSYWKRTVTFQCITQT